MYPVFKCPVFGSPLYICRITNFIQLNEKSRTAYIRSKSQSVTISPCKNAGANVTYNFIAVQKRWCKRHLLLFILFNSDIIEDLFIGSLLWFVIVDSFTFSQFTKHLFFNECYPHIKCSDSKLILIWSYRGDLNNGLVWCWDRAPQSNSWLSIIQAMTWITDNNVQYLDMNWTTWPEI